MHRPDQGTGDLTLEDDLIGCHNTCNNQQWLTSCVTLDRCALLPSHGKCTPGQTSCKLWVSIWSHSTTTRFPSPFRFSLKLHKTLLGPKQFLTMWSMWKFSCKNQDALGSRASPDCVSAVPCQDLFPERASGGRRVCWLRLLGWLVPGGIQIQDTVIAARRAQPSITYLIWRPDKYVL